MRSSDFYRDSDSPAMYLWDTWFGTARSSHRGQTVLKEIDACLREMEDKRLGLGGIWDKVAKAPCILGALLNYRSHANVVKHLSAYTLREAKDLAGSATFGRDYLKLAWTMAWMLAEFNDAGGEMETPEDRYWRMRKIIGGMIRPETLVAQAA